MIRATMSSYLITSTTILLFVAVLVAAATTVTNAFTASPQHFRLATALFGGKRRGRLTNNVSLDEDGNVARIMTKKEKQNLGSSKMKRLEKTTAAGISPLLAEWAKDGSTTPTTLRKDSASTTSVSGTVFAPFDDEDEGENDDDYDNDDDPISKKKRKSNKKAQQRSQRAALSAAQTLQIDSLLDQIDDMLQTTNLDRVELVSYISSLVKIGSSSNDQILLPTLKSIISTRPKKDEKQPSYRLAWVGSDAAICHIGTSLHKVPLARLQEVFLSLAYNKWELYEVIRILGPFPTVRNTLKGDVKLNKLPTEREGVRMQISYTSMIDGTGKEILAGKADNIKYVDLDVWFANEKVIVCTVPSEAGYEEEPLKGDGSNVLLFVVEENLDEQLEKLRAA